MAYDEYDDDEPRTAEEMLSAVRSTIDDLDTRIKKVSDTMEDATAGIRLEIAQNRKEMVELRATISRLQGRFDNQLMALVLANIASGVGVAAVVLGASSAFR